MFHSATESSLDEIKDRKKARENLLKFGVSFIDDALMGVAPADLVLIGAPSGIGKTELCCLIAKTNVEAGRRVHFIPLESDKFEIERRLKYKIIADKFFKMKDRPQLAQKLTFDAWRMGDFIKELRQIEIEAIEEFDEKYKNLFLYRKTKDFTVIDLIEQVVGNAGESDLFLIDHAHYFDFDDDNENRAMKDLAKTVRQLAIDENKAIVLVAHLRKRDRHNQELVPGLDEFHGSSDLTKIATRVVTIAPGELTEKGGYETFFRVPKNRLNGGSKMFIGRMVFNPQLGRYEDGYRLGRAGLTRDIGFEDILESSVPDWAKHYVAPDVSSIMYPVPQTRKKTKK